MNRVAQLRIGSLEISLALFVFALVVSRVRPLLVWRARSVRGYDLRLEVHDAPGTAAPVRNLSFTLDDGSPAVLVGRSSTAQVGLLDPEVSRQHAKVQFTRGALYLRDLGSRNGTFLNGKRLDDQGIEVRTGDDIDVGNARLKVVETVPRSWT